MIADARFAARLPKGDAAELAPLLCAGLTAYGALRRADLKAGETVAIFGCGGLGLYAVQLAKRLGATVIAIDKDPEKIKAAAALGAEVENSQRAHVCINFAPNSCHVGDDDCNDPTARPDHICCNGARICLVESGVAAEYKCQNYGHKCGHTGSDGRTYGPARRTTFGRLRNKNCFARYYFGFEGSGQWNCKRAILHCFLRAYECTAEGSVHP